MDVKASECDYSFLFCLLGEGGGEVSDLVVNGVQYESNSALTYWPQNDWTVPYFPEDLVWTEWLQQLLEHLKVPPQ